MIVNESWCWDENNKSEKVSITNKKKAATFFEFTISEGTAGEFSCSIFHLNSY